MATISSLGIGSGLNSAGIVSQLVALEKAPLKNLQAQATIGQGKISTFGTIQSQFSALAEAATAMSTASAWTARNASSSNTSAATITASSTAGATSFTLDVDALAQSQSVASPQIAQGTAVGAGTLTLRLGTWASDGSSFTPGASSSDVSITVTGTDTIATIAAKINSGNSGVVATAFNDGTNDRLLLRSKSTGAAAGFRLQATSSAPSGTGDDLTRLSFDPATPATATTGMAGAGLPVSYGSDAKARINGLAVTSGTNTLAGNIPGVTINLLATTTTNYNNVGGTEVKNPATMTVSENVTPAVQNIQKFVDAYNALAANLADLTKYDAAQKQGALFQGDAAILGMQSVLRSIAGSVTSGSSAYSRLSDVGIERQLDGTLSINTTKLAAAANNGTELQKLFTTNNSNTLTDGFALKFKNFGNGVLATGGSVANKAKSLQAELDRNAKEQKRVNDKASQVESRLNAQYSALDGRMASLNALSAYVAQQVTTWNKSTG